MEQLIYYIFGACVTILLWLGNLTGLGYMGINVLIFCVIWPIFTVWLIWLVFKQRKVIRELRTDYKSAT